MELTKSTGEIITFYSYKGGTGRSMALANVAWILASNGKRVLVVDWDLEAPGVHRYFSPFLLDKELIATEGVIDIVTKYSLAALTPPEGKDPKDWYVPHANILRYATSLNWLFPDKGRIDFIPAGQQGTSYSSRVNSFNWQEFYSRFGGWAFLEEVKKRMKSEYDYILIDSRTGVSDTSGICTVQMPDTLVVCLTLNNQSIEGAFAVASSVREQCVDKKITILPVFTRIENAEKDKLEQRKEYAIDKFFPFMNHLSSSESNKYFGKMNFPYVPYYAYEEILSIFGDKHGNSNTILESAEILTSHITKGAIKTFKDSGEALRRKEVLKAYASQNESFQNDGVAVKSLNSIYNKYIRFTKTKLTPVTGVFVGIISCGYAINAIYELYKDRQQLVTTTEITKIELEKTKEQLSQIVSINNKILSNSEAKSLLNPVSNVLYKYKIDIHIINGNTKSDDSAIKIKKYISDKFHVKQVAVTADPVDYYTRMGKPKTNEIRYDYNEIEDATILADYLNSRDNTLNLRTRLVTRKSTPNVLSIILIP